MTRPEHTSPSLFSPTGSSRSGERWRRGRRSRLPLRFARPPRQRVGAGRASAGGPQPVNLTTQAQGWIPARSRSPGRGLRRRGWVRAGDEDDLGQLGILQHHHRRAKAARGSHLTDDVAMVGAGRVQQQQGMAGGCCVDDHELPASGWITFENSPNTATSSVHGESRSSCNAARPASSRFLPFVAMIRSRYAWVAAVGRSARPATRRRRPAGFRPGGLPDPWWSGGPRGRGGPVPRRQRRRSWSAHPPLPMHITRPVLPALDVVDEGAQRLRRRVGGATACDSSRAMASSYTARSSASNRRRAGGRSCWLA